MSNNQQENVTYARTFDLTQQDLLDALSLDKIEAWAIKFYADGGEIPHCAYPLSENCLVALYMNDTFSNALPKDFMIIQGRFHTKVLETIYDQVVMQVITPIEIKYLIDIYDEEIRVVGKRGQYALDEVLELIGRARAGYDADYNPVHLMNKVEA